VDNILAEGAGLQWDPCIIEQVMGNRLHFHALWESAAPSPETPASAYVVDGWNANRSSTTAMCANTGPPVPTGTGFREAALS